MQIAPGGPVEQAVAAIEFGQSGALPGAGSEGVRASHAQTGVGNISDSNYRGGGVWTRKSSRKSLGATGSISPFMSVISKCFGTIFVSISATACFVAPLC
ncbi:Oligopeptide transport system permease protein OppB (TC 3.A.1.5.1) [Citrobacter freundii]|uniref:Oligopeptide transport system permease protein OppB (TC 3.A.1.5.1) n=1 Tax=Citrobacter freundii TaxID=546 RepID=A0A7G2IJB2_CITFR|nr:Oligopeptide transport system permease protein OppB (TC 3.A.1.5.1) [Citrobacter freundii]